MGATSSGEYRRFRIATRYTPEVIPRLPGRSAEAPPDRAGAEEARPTARQPPRRARPAVRLRGLLGLSRRPGSPVKSTASAASAAPSSTPRSSASSETPYFMKVVNLSPSHEIEITHIGFDTHPLVHIDNRARPLPARLRLGPADGQQQVWGMMGGQARWPGLVMGFDTHMIAGNRACSTSGSATHPTITARQARTLPRPCHSSSCRPRAALRKSRASCNERSAD